MSAIDAALSTIDRVASEGDLAPERPTDFLELDALTEPIVLPDGKRIYPPRLHGEPIDELACALIDTDRPAESTFLRLIGPPGSGKSQLARCVAYRLWRARGRDVENRHGVPFYGFVEITGGPSSDEYLFRHEFVPAADDAGTVRLVDSAFVQAMREGWVVMIDEVNTIRDVALLSINSCLDGRLSLYLPATGETVIAQPGFACLLAYNPGLVGATDIPDAWHSRFPATLEVTSNWPALAQLGAPRALVTEAMALDRQRIAGEDGLTWTPQFRDIEALARMIDRVGERAALALFISNLSEQVQAGKVQDAEAAAVCRMLDQAGYAHLKVSATRRLAKPARLPTSGHLMSATQTSGRPAVFVAQLHRAAAQRGKLDPVYQELSDHWTAILQRLYPVWALIGPGLSDPGHIEIHSRTDLPRLRHPARHPRADPRQPARAAGGAALLRCRAARDLPRQAHQTLDDRARHRAQRIGEPRRSSARDRPAAARGAAHGSPRRPRAPARHAPWAVRAPRAPSGGHRRDPHRVRRRAPRLGDGRQTAHARHGRPRHRLPAGPHPLRHPRPDRPGPTAQRVAARSRRPGSRGTG